MMGRRALMMSLTLSCLAMYLVWQYVSSEDARMQDQYGTFFPMVVASRDILQYQTIRPTDIEVIRVPKAMDPPGRIADPRDVIDAVAAIPITKGEHILENKIMSKNVYSGLDTQVAIGKRAVSIPVNQKSSIGFNIHPGNRVDLANYFEYKSPNGPITEIKVFLQDLLVLASGTTIQPNPPKGVDQDITRELLSNEKVRDATEAKEILDYAKSNRTYNTITLEVTPQQAQIIAYVMTVFAESMTVLLRHTDDRQLERKASTNLREALGPMSYYNREKKAPPIRNSPRPRFYDVVGGQKVPVY
jgi:Flp pilus assembly protein CpaB